MIEIRKMTRNDIPKIKALPLSAHDDMKVHRNNIEKLDSNCVPEHACVAVEDGNVIGFAHGTKLGNIFSTSYLFVKPSNRKNGIGKELLKSLEKTSNCTDFIITHHESLHRYYSKLGYNYDNRLTAGWIGEDARRYAQMASFLVDTF